MTEAPAEYMPRHAKPPELVPGEVARVDGHNRLCVPATILKAMDWKSDEVITLMSDLFAPGRVRLYREDVISALVERKREVLLKQASEDPVALETLSVLADRYRPASLYADGRVRLKEAVAVFLGYTPPERPYLYIRALPRYLEIMSLERRNELLDQFDPEINV